MAAKGKNIILGVCGGIASYKTAGLVRILKKQSFNVTCIMTKEALNFITPLTLMSLSGNKVYVDLFDLPEKIEPAHISLADLADIIVVIPATCHTIAKLSLGLCDDILCCTVLATKAPVLVCPAMHENMYKKEIVKQNIRTLKERGFEFAGPVKGDLLNGKKGFGHLEDLQVIVRYIKKIIK